MLKDPFLSDRIIFISNSFNEIVREIALTAFLYALPLSIPLILLLLLKKYCGFKQRLILAALICLVTFNIYIGIMQSTASYSTHYLYGQEGVDGTIKYLQNLIDRNDVIITEKDIVYYIGLDKWYPLPQNPNDFLNLTGREHISYIVLAREGYYTTRKYSDVIRLVEERYKLNAQFGDFKIYQKES